MPKKGSPATGESRPDASPLPYMIQYRICAMLQDGVSPKTIAEDPEIRNAYERIGKRPTDSAIARIKRTPEYREISQRRTVFRREQENESLTAAMLQETGAAENTADSIKISLLKTIAELTALSSLSKEEDKIKAVRSLTQSVAVLSNAAKDRTIYDLKNKLAHAIASKKRLNAEIEQLKLKHENEIRRIRENNLKSAEPERVADELADILGVRKK